jgi:ATP-binding cassette subfamily B multidrug efflux pump
MLWKILRKYLAPFSRPLAYVVLLQLVGTIASLYLPSLNADIIDNGVIPGDTAYIVQTGVWMLGISLVQVAVTVAAVYFGSRTAMMFGRDLRSSIFYRVGEFSSREMARFGAPSLITRTTNDVQQVQMVVVMSLTMMVSAPITMVGGVIMAVREDVGLSWLVVAAIPVLAVSLGLIISQMIPGYRKMQGHIDTVNRVLREQATGIRVLRAFVREPFEVERFRRANTDLTEVSVNVGRWMAAIFPVVMLVMNVASVAVLWFGAGRIDAGSMQVGSLVAFLAYMIQILMSVMMATFMLVMIPRAAVSAKRIGEVLDAVPSVVPPKDGIAELTLSGHLELRDAGFTYPGATAPVLADINFTAKAGQVTAIVGSTGSGKTSLLGLIPRLYDTTAGSVLVGGFDVRDIEPELLWSKIGLVPQTAYLFTGTVASNLKYGRPEATDEDMWAALTVAQAKEFVEAMPDGLDSPISQGGTNVSGGQRQRLAIARALILKPEIYLFDDSFSALDLTTDSRLRAALRPTTENATVLIVAQRVSTIIDADQIIVLDNGSIVGKGSHSELLETCQTYQEIVASQLEAGVPR